MFRIVDRGGAVVAAAAAVVCLATLSWIATGGSSGRYYGPGVGYPGANGESPSLSAPSATSADGPAAAAQPSARTGDLTGGTVTPFAAATDAQAGAPVGPTASGGPMTASPSALSSGIPADTSPSPGASVPVSGPPKAPWSPTWPSGAPAGAPSTNASVAPSPSPSGSASPMSTPTASASAGPSEAARAGGLAAGPPRSAPGRRAGCVRITVPFANEGAAPVRSGRIVITTDVVDPIGVVWARYRATEPLPVPIAPGARTSATYELCADDWLVPPGTRLEATGVSLFA